MLFFLALIFIINKEEFISIFTLCFVFQNYLSVSLSDDAQPKLRLGYISYNDDPASKKQFTYDAEGRLYSCVKGLDSILYIYCADSIIQYNRHPDKFWEYKTSFVLDPSDKALNAWTYDGFGNKVREENYTYDSEERLTYYYRYIYANNEVWQYHFNYPNDSVTQITTMLPDGSSGNAYTFTYNLQKRNDFQPTFVGNWFDSCPLNLFGVEPTFLPQSILCTGPEGDTLSHINYRYPFADNHVFLTILETDVLNQFTNTITCYAGKK